jgi:hypothetical protein
MSQMLTVAIIDTTQAYYTLTITLAAVDQPLIRKLLQRVGIAV